MQKSLHLLMKFAASLTLLAILIVPTQALAQTYENFDNLALGSTPGNGGYIGNNGNPWPYINCRGDVEITGKAITMGVNGAYSNLTGYEITGNLQTLSFDYMQVGPDPATVYIIFNNGDYITSRTTSDEGVVVNSGPITIGGGWDVKVEFTTNTGGKEIALDNIKWTITPDNIEIFDNLVADEYNFEDGDFIGENSHEWEYYNGKKGELYGPAITFGEENGYLKCGDINNGIYSLSFDYVQRDWVAVDLAIFINGETFTTIYTDSEYPMNTGELIVDQAEGINGYPLSIEFYNNGGEVTIDNIAWTNRPASYTEFTGTGNWSDLSKWSGGIPHKNSDAFIKGNATIDVAATASYVGVEPEGTLNLLEETLASETLTIRADATGSGSFIGSSSFLDISYAFLHWHITSGVPEAWHLLSSPVPNQSLTSYNNPFAPPGSGYDFYAWDEPTEMWLNRKVSANNINSFVPGKGYLVAYQDISIDKFFGGYTFNSGTISMPVTAPGMPGKSSNGIHAGANLLGNPYPSSIDWKNNTDLDKNNLKLESGGRAMYVWNDAVNNYGAYIDNAFGDVGTNGVGRFIPPLQGFFVIAQTDGNFVFNDGARVHSTQQYMKSGNEEGFRLSVQSPGDDGKDEILLDFGHTANQGGADKWFSMSAKAPSLYVPSYEKDYSIRFLSSASDNPLIPVAFKAGVNGEYTIRSNYSTTFIPSVQLKDLLTGNIHDLSANAEYTFTAGTGDDANRFVLIFGALGIDHPESESGIQVYAHAGILYLNNQSVVRAAVKVYNLTGQLVMEGKAGGNALTTYNVAHLGTGIYLVNLVTDERVVSQKVAFPK